MSQPTTAIIVGAGHRALAYASYAQQRPDKLKIAGVADPLDYRRKSVQELFDLPDDRCFESAQQLAQQGQLADAVINGTMDADHVPTSLPLLEAGYDMLLEKPFAINVEEVYALHEAARRHKSVVMICHVLRYVPFYARIRQLIKDGAIGDVMNIQMCEHVTYHHMVVGYVRGKWRREEDGVGMLMAKSCHDLDIMMWMKSGIPPRQVHSYGSRMFFRPEKAPAGAGTHCLLNCPIEEDCLYSARKLFLDHPTRWGFYVYADLEEQANPTLEDKRRYLEQPDNQWARCVWKSDNNTVDHQTVAVQFDDGATASFDMVGGTARPSRRIHLLGTDGEIEGLDDSRIAVRHADPRPGHEYSEEIIDTRVTEDMTGAFGGHGGGDLRLVADFVEALQGGTPSISCTDLHDSIHGHLTGFYAEISRKENRPVSIAAPR